MTFHYANLSNGLGCPHLEGHLVPPRVVRVQSTWCEQQRWGDVLLTAGADLLYHLARGERCVVHDVSERDRETRACWQGLSWLRWALSRAWGVAPEPEVFKPSGMAAGRFWERTWLGLDDVPRTYAGRFRQWHRGGPVDLRSCWALSHAGPARHDVKMRGSELTCSCGYRCATRNQTDASEARARHLVRAAAENETGKVTR
jgi:hypothetical protein